MKGCKRRNTIFTSTRPSRSLTSITRSCKTGLEDGPISPAAFHSALQRFAAHAHIAHTRIEGFNPGFLDYMSDEALVFPLSFEVREGE
ncbi:MAG: hypothetical protein JKP95_00385 [Oceanicaulis sp.]|nr:hypothetical protein [Oceanicaulis sp.]